ncbi:GGDEF domain-containing protein [Acetobacterium carbinolicum]|uniref:GGDEF domain-containing protein n=1 Tax=Acetobacterium carbinolicum TaxID=52690 RepID=UPI0039C9BE03
MKLEIKKDWNSGYLVQDAGLVLLLVCIFTGAITLGTASEELFLESALMLIGTFLAVLFAGFKLTGLAIVIAAFDVLAYTVYRLFLLYASYSEVPLTGFIWALLPIAAVGAMTLFISGSRKTELENDILREQVEELVMINPLTGLYNLRSLYFDLEKQISYVARNNMALSLMLIELRYEPELKRVLSRNQYETVLQKMAILIRDSIRTEDRIYSTNHKGSIGVILTCDREGSDFVQKRIKDRISERGAFQEKKDVSIKIDIRIACLQYSKEEYDGNIMLFKQKVESELQYDV